MDFKIIKKEKNALFSREDVTFAASETGATPTRLEVRDLIAAKTGAKAEAIAVVSINSEFGRAAVCGTAHIYSSQKDMEKTEPKHILKRNSPKQKEKKEAPAEEAKSEDKAETEEKSEDLEKQPETPEEETKEGEEQ